MKNIQTIISTSSQHHFDIKNIILDTIQTRALKIYFFPLLYKLQLDFLSIFIAIYCALNYLFHVIRERKGKVSLFYPII